MRSAAGLYSVLAILAVLAVAFVVWLALRRGSRAVSGRRSAARARARDAALWEPRVELSEDSSEYLVTLRRTAVFDDGTSELIETRVLEHVVRTDGSDVEVELAKMNAQSTANRLNQGRAS